MANRIKRNSEIDSNALNIGAWSISSKDGMGPSASTRFYNGPEVPVEGYVIYSDDIDAKVALNDNELISILNKMGASIATDDLARGLQWAKENDILIVDSYYSNIAADDMITVNLDSEHISSYFPTVETTNLLSSGNPNATITWTNSGDWTVNNNATDVEKPFTNHGGASNVLTVMRGQSVTTGSQHWGCAGFSGSASTTYTISVWFRQSRAGSNQPYFRTNVNNNSLGNFNWNGDTNAANWPVNQWIRISCTATLQSNETGAYLSNYLGGAVGDIVWYYAPMVQLGSVMTPFVHGTRSLATEWMDLSGNRNNATLNNGVTYNSSERALQFDGVNDYATIDPFNGKPTSQITCESWIKPMKSTISGTIRGGAISASNSMYLGIINSVDGTTHAMHWANQTSDNRAYNWNGSIPNNQWAHIVGTYDGSVARAYVNGVEISNWSQTGTIPDATYYVGTYGGGLTDGIHNFQGLIRDAKIYKTALTSTQVMQNYFKGKVVTTGLQIMSDPGSLISKQDTDSTLANLIGTGFTIEGASSKMEDHGGILRLDTGRIYRYNTGWYGKMAISWWMRYNGAAVATNFYTENYRGSGGCARIYSPILSDGRFRFSVWDNSSIGPLGGGSFSVDTTTQVCDGEWHHITCQWSNGTGNKPRGIYVYVDGSLEGRTDIIGNDGAYEHLHLGGASGCVGESSHSVDFGPITHHVNYNLSDNEVYQNYAAHVARFK
jgi:hypothetical protein